MTTTFHKQIGRSLTLRTNEVGRRGHHGHKYRTLRFPKACQARWFPRAVEPSPLVTLKSLQFHHAKSLCACNVFGFKATGIMLAPRLPILAHGSGALRPSTLHEDEENPLRLSPNEHNWPALVHQRHDNRMIVISKPYSRRTMSVPM